jgi:hypothetical protein
MARKWTIAKQRGGGYGEQAFETVRKRRREGKKTLVTVRR